MNTSFKFDWAKESEIDLDLDTSELNWRVEYFIDYIYLEGKSFKRIDQSWNKIFDIIIFDLKFWAKRYDNLRYYINRYPDRIIRSIHLIIISSFD